MKGHAESTISVPMPLGKADRFIPKIRLIRHAFPRRKIDKTLTQAFKNTGIITEKFASVRLNNWVESNMVRVERDMAG
ncbi:hypothetical protein AMJ80_07375 [bacterium SM23_31]|nr:MAG: hypothetical protein AMJ80_07375 [bacterium SM23_31]